MTTRSKRLRGASLGAGDASGDHDFPLHMDPSLMTERQQLAFLLRKTAQENGQDVATSSRDSSSESDGSDDDDAPRRAPKKLRRSAPSSKTSPKSPPPASREDLIAAALKNPASLVLYCGRGRPPKNAIKLAPGEEMPADLKKLVETATHHHLRRRDTDANANNANASVSDAVKDLRVQTDASETRRRDDDERDTSNAAAREEGDRSEDSAKRKTNQHDGGDSNAKSQIKTSPSSASELSQHLRDVYEDHHGEFALATPCALCCRVGSPFGAPLEALFLCPTCDRKYPTQRALGLV